MAQAKRVLIAHVGRAHGVRGDVVLKCYAEDPNVLPSYGALSDESGQRTFHVARVRVSPKEVVAHLSGFDDRTAAEGLRGLALYVDRTALPAADAGAFYHVDLIGLTTYAPEGGAFGKVIAVEDFGAGPLLELGLKDQADTVYVPFTDAFVPVVDIAAGRLTVIIPNMVGDPEPSEGSG